MNTPASLSKSPVSSSPARRVMLGHSSRHFPGGTAKTEHVTLEGEPYICMRNVDALSPFLMSVVSNGDNWLFVGSNSPFTAGRVDPNHSIFPYQTVDKILRHADSSGALSVLQVQSGEGWALWEPWATCGGPYQITRNLYKHALGTSVVFEEINHDLRLRFRWELSTSDQFGLVRSCSLENLGSMPASIRYLDGWHQLMPSGVSQETFTRYSYLAAAYMRHERQEMLGIYTLNSGITDRAEPCESLRVTCAWSIGHQNPAILLCDRQVDDFRRGFEIEAENEVRGEFGAYLVASSVDLEPHESHGWMIGADTSMDHSAVVQLQALLLQPEKMKAEVKASLAANAGELRQRIAAADGLQHTADHTAGVHHFANALFNCMRGGTLVDSYRFPTSDFATFLRSRNKNVYAQHRNWIARLPASLTLDGLRKLAAAWNDPQLARLSLEYLPLTFSRRHGDPSRPWNSFAIHLKDGLGQPLYGYQGNWRDIFQNWESLAQSYPNCLESMVAIFLNASTADGYNPYRITRAGIDWEVLDHEDPWSHIGYWGDHQIVYLLRLLESLESHQPGRLATGIRECLYAYAVVPYEIGGFKALTADPKKSINFNESLHRSLVEKGARLGNDGKLFSVNDEVLLVSLAEKLLVPALVKLSNLVPGGGIWLNTQRPEWNDANNALAGWGLSMVTVCHLRRYLHFLDSVFADAIGTPIPLQEPVAVFLSEVANILGDFSPKAADCNDATRLEVLTRLGEAGAKHRSAVYEMRLAGQSTTTPKQIREFLASALAVVDGTIRVNLRADGLVHSYNLLTIAPDGAMVRHLGIMLEGQTAVLGSGLLAPAEVLSLVEALRSSDLYRADQHSYLLYPDRQIAPYLTRNILPPGSLARVPVLTELLEGGDRSLVTMDESGDFHFNADLTNEGDLLVNLDRLSGNARLGEAVQRDRKAILELWEEVFHHSVFTGRSGTMFGFEGLGSIYWHMVAKLLLAIQECHQLAKDKAPEVLVARLAAAYDDIRLGLGFTKTPSVYGAFPTDPYSHSPRSRGAQQPGMTGQVKEEILTRFGELGVVVQRGRIEFAPVLLHRSEFFTEATTFDYVDVSGAKQSWKLPPGSLGFTYCQVPVCYELGDKASITVHGRDVAGKVHGSILSALDSASVFSRNGEIQKIHVMVSHDSLRP